MSSARLGVLVAFLSVSLVARRADAQRAAPMQLAGRVVGVYDDRTGNPLEGVEVRDLVTKSFALTTSTGTLSLFFVDSAGSLVRFQKIGYTPTTMFVENSPAAPPLTITLEPIAQTLPTVVTRDSARRYVSPALREFEERRLSGSGGRFVSEAVLRKEDDRTLGNIIKLRVPGLDVLQDVLVGLTRADIAVTTRSGTKCPVDIYLDGQPVSLRSTATGRSAIPGAAVVRDRESSVPMNDLKSFSPKDLAGIEFHSAATVPTQYNRSASGCGVLLLWTRER
jgi:hypothetical protein